jgi:hypothetical protein
MMDPSIDDETWNYDDRCHDATELPRWLSTSVDAEMRSHTSVQPTKGSRRRAVAAAGGAVLFSLGLREAVRLRDADLESARSRARQLGATRIVAGIALLLRPQLLAAALGLSAAGGAGWWLSRMLAVREIAVGTGTVAASHPRADPWPWLMTVSAIDGAEALVLFTALRRKAVDQPGGWAFVAADAGSAAALVTRIAHIRRLTTRGVATR